MRNAFVKRCTELMERDERVFLVTADMGYFIFDDIRRRFGRRFINVGIAEANMIGVAAGLALSGKIPFVYTVTSFATSRVFEQLKVDVCYQKANVKIVGIGSGIAYGTSGPTHQAIMDIALMRALPGMTIFSPADARDAVAMTDAAYGLEGPVYLRLGKQNEPLVTPQDSVFSIGRGMILRDGRSAAVIATGSIVKQALQAAEELSHEGIDVRVISMGSLKPADRELILAAARETGVILTLEEHTIHGGLGSIVAEIIAENAGPMPVFRRLGLDDTFCCDYGTDAELLACHHIDSASVSAVIKELV
jgi:transketolase